MSSITITELRKTYGPTVACDSVTASFAAGSITCLLGPSGCGKTTMLRMVAGLESPDSGTITLGDDDVTGLPTDKRDLGMVFQYPVVYRGLTVRENLALPLRRAGRTLSSAERRNRVDQLIDIMALNPVAGRSVDGLPNGMRQKVAVARAMIRRPSVVLFDEPVTNVDLVSKLEIQRDIKRLVQELGQTVLYVTHDQTEAMTLADRIVLLRDGRIVESGSPREVFRTPHSRFGGYFLGSPGMNFLPAVVSPGSDTVADVSCLLFSAPISVRLIGDTGQAPVVGIRAEFIRVTADPVPGAVALAVAARSLGAGGRWLLECPLGDEILRIKVPPSNPARNLKRIWALAPAKSVLLFDAEGTCVGSGSEETGRRR